MLFVVSVRVGVAESWQRLTSCAWLGVVGRWTEMTWDRRSDALIHTLSLRSSSAAYNGCLQTCLLNRLVMPTCCWAVSTAVTCAVQHNTQLMCDTALHVHTLYFLAPNMLWSVCLSSSNKSTHTAQTKLPANTPSFENFLDLLWLTVL